MHEQVIAFGARKEKIGVLTRPVPPQSERRSSAVVFWNSGLLHRVGPHRMYVELCRDLAARGFTPFRFDLSGRGDSARSRTTDKHADSNCADVTDALDMLQQQHGAEQFVLVGLCSGAREAHQVALHDRRVSGLILLDGFSYGYGSWRYHWHYYLSRLTDRRGLSRRLAHPLDYLKRRLRRVPKEKGQNPVDEGALMAGRMPASQQFKAQLQELIDREVRILYVYTGKLGDYSYRRQLEDSFPDLQTRGQLRVEFYPDADHTFTRRTDRNVAMKCIQSWLEEQDFSRQFPVAS